MKKSAAKINYTRIARRRPDALASGYVSLTPRSLTDTPIQSKLNKNTNFLKLNRSVFGGLALAAVSVPLFIGSLIFFAYSIESSILSFIACIFIIVFSGTFISGLGMVSLYSDTPSHSFEVPDCWAIEMTKSSNLLQSLPVNLNYELHPIWVEMKAICARAMFTPALPLREFCTLNQGLVERAQILEQAYKIWSLREQELQRQAHLLSFLDANSEAMQLGRDVNAGLAEGLRVLQNLPQ